MKPWIIVLGVFLPWVAQAEALVPPGQWSVTLREGGARGPVLQEEVKCIGGQDVEDAERLITAATGMKCKADGARHSKGSWGLSCQRGGETLQGTMLVMPQGDHIAIRLKQGEDVRYWYTATYSRPRVDEKNACGR